MESKTANQRRAGPEPAERPAVETAVQRRTPVDFQNPRPIDAEGRFPADVSAEVERRRRMVALYAQRRREREADVLAHLEVRIQRGRVVLIAPRIVVPVIEVEARLEPIRGAA